MVPDYAWAGVRTDLHSGHPTSFWPAAAQYGHSAVPPLPFRCGPARVPLWPLAVAAAAAAATTTAAHPAGPPPTEINSSVTDLFLSSSVSFSCHLPVFLLVCTTSPSSIPHNTTKDLTSFQRLSSPCIFKRLKFSSPFARQTKLGPATCIAASPFLLPPPEPRQSACDQPFAAQRTLVIQRPPSRLAACFLPPSLLLSLSKALKFSIA